MPPKQKPSESSTADDSISIDKHGRPIGSAPIGQPSKPLKTRFWKLHHWHHFSRRTKIISLLFFTVLGAALAYFGLFLTGKVSAPGGISLKKSKPAITSPLTGLPTTKEGANRPVTAIMIENSPDARPQSGLRTAGVVFEAIAEGGITRFVTLFQEAQPQYVGPVRSLRPYFYDWAQGFDASVAHVGGSPKALKQIRHGGKDLDQFFNSPAYWRINSRAAPHNVYTSFANLDKLNKQKGYKHSNFNAWPRRAEAPLKTPKARTISLAISGPLYNVGYQYSQGANDYKRKEGGAYHVSTQSPRGKAKIIRPKVVIAMIVSYGIASDGHHSDYRTIGKGLAYIFQDGNVVKARWVKKAKNKNVMFYNSKGDLISLDAGQTWVTAVDSRGAIRWHK